MSIVLNEHDWALEMINGKTLGKKPFETLCRVARYSLDNGYTKKETRDYLDSFVLQCDQSASLPKWSATLDRAVARAMKHEAINIDSVIITNEEIAIINNINGAQTKRLAFVLLCLAKYWDAVVPSGNHWANTKDNEIMKMANINTSIKRQSMMYASLRESGLIEFSKKVDNTNVRVLFITDGEEAFRITDFRNLGSQYLLETGSKDYYRCQNCGLVVKMNIPASKRCKGGRPPKYCKSCANDINIRNTINRIMNSRSKSSKNSDS